MRLACLIAPLLVTPLIHAAPPGETPIVPTAPVPTEQPTERVTESYRNQTLLADGAAVSLLLLGAGTQSLGMAKVSLATYWFGSPIVHAAHSNGTSFFLSVGMRVGFPLIAGLVASRLEPTCSSDDDTECGDDEFVGDRVAAGLLLGVVSAMVVDHAFLAKHTVTRTSQTVTPTATPIRGGMTLGLAGTF
jgi:hypothetical protein